MMFTPMTRRSLQAAQEEQVRLGHAAVEPAHLLLALLKAKLPPRRDDNGCVSFLPSFLPSFLLL